MLPSDIGIVIRFLHHEQSSRGPPYSAYILKLSLRKELYNNSKQDSVRDCGSVGDCMVDRIIGLGSGCYCQRKRSLFRQTAAVQCPVSVHVQKKMRNRLRLVQASVARAEYLC